MLPADSDLQIGARTTAPLHADGHQRPDALFVDRDERVSIEDPGLEVRPEIMIPLVSHVGELRRLRALVEEEAERVLAAGGGPRVRLQIGTMIEVPRAALTADAIAEEADFFSFEIGRAHV